MRAKTTITALALTAAATAAMAGPASAATKTSISMQVQQGGVFGFVKSSASSCHSGRKVTVYRKVSGPDKKAGSDIAQPNQDGSQYSVSLTRAGKYYAKVNATSKCKGATSKTRSFKPSENASASHNISLGEAKEKVRKVRTVRLLNDPKLPYVKARTGCRLKYKGHSHWAVCTITFETKNDVNACQEKLDAYIQIRGSGVFDPFARDGVFVNHIWPLPRGAKLCKPGSRILRTVPPSTG